LPKEVISAAENNYLGEMEKLLIEGVFYFDAKDGVGR